MNGELARGRYAPSPTGDLHLGNLRTALLAWLFARSAGGAFVLRLEDLDTPRLRPGASARLFADLRWLGLDWDEGPDCGGPLGPYRQSRRHALYENALARLRARGLLYPCYCTRAELRAVASAPHVGEVEHRYPGTCRTLTDRERSRRQAEGRQPALRFHAPDQPVSFTDEIAGPIAENVQAAVGDIIVRRGDGLFAYQLAVVIDDALMGITQVVRGADLLSSTARQLALYDALGYQRPRSFAHVPLALDVTGARLSKREAPAGLEPLRASGVAASRVLGALAASCGLWPDREPTTPAALLRTFAPNQLRTAPSAIVV
jgi:glutamyl-tRNA synthetase